MPRSALIMTTLAERVAQLALSKFDALPQKCKPRTLDDGSREWTPLSAVVLAQGQTQDLTCISLATGTKCLPASALPKCMGLVLHDSHAEVLALRGFNHWLLHEVFKMLQHPTYESQFLESSLDEDSQSSLGQPVDRQDIPFRLKSNVSIYFFTTEAPCGDASMEILMNSFPTEAAVPWPVENEDVADLQGRGHFSLLGRVRRKPARADAEPSLSKSCTDKLAVKQFTSAISFPADLFLQRSQNSYIHSLVIYDDQYHPIGYQRAFGQSGRLSALKNQGRFFGIERLPLEFPRFFYQKPQPRFDGASRPKSKASNISLLWVAGSVGSSDNVLEILINGVKQGYQQWDKRPSKASAASRQGLWRLGTQIDSLMLKNHLEVNGSNSSTASSGVDRHTEVHVALSSETYDQAKSTVLRTAFNKSKWAVTSHMGNWNRNSGDDNWGCR